ncbi:hypothetical protein Y032_0160g3337 [Ancylostoma ceylanicum]|uniref:Uncharacterized protein n=1 Tax=Ancylostoma ceylanicum TaxID=53326 RepID=A0A016SY70_9BILA|nr:hypothetical protein Y032_0160g3337 [Ancylostoma ceylanicum]
MKWILNITQLNGSELLLSWTKVCCFFKGLINEATMQSSYLRRVRSRSMSLDPRKRSGRKKKAGVVYHREFLQKKQNTSIDQWEAVEMYAATRPRRTRVILQSRSFKFYALDDFAGSDSILLSYSTFENLPSFSQRC